MDGYQEAQEQLIAAAQQAIAAYRACEHIGPEHHHTLDSFVIGTFGVTLEIRSTPGGELWGIDVTDATCSGQASVYVASVFVDIDYRSILARFDTFAIDHLEQVIAVMTAAGRGAGVRQAA